MAGGGVGGVGVSGVVNANKKAVNPSDNRPKSAIFCMILYNVERWKQFRWKETPLFTAKVTNAIELCSGNVVIKSSNSAAYKFHLRQNFSTLPFVSALKTYFMKNYVLLAVACVLAVAGCKKEDPAGAANLQFQFKFDTTQPRLNNFGQPAPIPAGNAAQTPEFRHLSVHYIELAPNALTQLGAGAVVYHAEETSKGGEAAVDFDKAAKAGENGIFTKISLKNVPPGIYDWVRASVTYQNYDVYFNINEVPVAGDLLNQKGTVASFVGFNTYISSIRPRSQSLAVNDDKKQGFWAFETELSAPYTAYNQLFSGDAPAGATTVVNPLFASSPIPAGSCVVTGKFAKPLVITGQETNDITVTLSFSVNQSFEWIDTNGNGALDIYAAQSAKPSEKIVDMGLRGLIPSW